LQRSSSVERYNHFLCQERSAAFEALPSAVKNIWPRTGGPEGEVDQLCLSYRSMLAEQAFVAIYAHVSKLELEAPAGVRGPLADNAECPQRKVLGAWRCIARDKECPRCGGRGWTKSKT